MSTSDHFPSFPPVPQRAQQDANRPPAYLPGPPVDAPDTMLGADDPTGPQVTRARRRRGGRVAIWLLSVCLVLTLAAGGYLLVLARAWNKQAASLDAVVQEQSARITATEEELAVSQSELKETAAQLATAQERITELANEKAQAGDSQAATAQLLDYQQRVSSAAGQVASALGECITGQENLIKYLKDPSRYDPESLSSYQIQVEQFCAQANEANTTLQQELQK